MLSINIKKILEGGCVGDFSKGGDTSNIYFLIKNSEVSYVGQTLNLYQRRQRHASKKFDNLAFIVVPFEFAHDAEAFYIAKFNPLHNKAMNNRSLLFVNDASISKEISKDIRLNMHSYIDKRLIAYTNKNKRAKEQKTVFYVDKSLKDEIIKACSETIKESCLKATEAIAEKAAKTKRAAK